MNTPLFDLSAGVPVTRSDLVARFREFCAWNREALHPQHPNHITYDYQRKLLSHLNRALDVAGVSEDCEEDVRIVMTNLHITARQVGLGASASIQVVRRIAFGFTFEEAMRLPKGAVILPTEFEALLAFGDPDDKRARSRLTVIVRVLEALGVLAAAPARMPLPGAIRAAAPTIGISHQTIQQSLPTYRQLRALAIEANPANGCRFDVLLDERRLRGTNAIAVLARSGDDEHRDLLGTDIKTVVERLAPRLHKQMCKYESEPLVGARLNRASTVEAVWSTVGRLVGTLLEYDPACLSDFEIGKLWREDRVLAARETEKQEDLYDADDVPAEVKVSFGRWVIEHMGMKSRTVCAPDASRGFLTATVRDEANLWALTDCIHGHRLRAQNEARWVEWYGRHIALMGYLKKSPVAEDQLTQQLDKLAVVSLASLPHIVCVGLPVLAREAERALARIADCESAARKAGHGDPATHPAVKQAIFAFAGLAERYLLTALVFADGGRSKHYRRGLWGLHFRLEVEADGTWGGLTTVWTGRRGDPTRTKASNARTRTLGPAHVSLQVLRGYVEHVRFARLTARGWTPAAAMAADGSAPLFVSPLGSAKSNDNLEFSKTTLAQHYAETLHRIASELLGRDLPALTGLDRQGDWYGVFGVHGARTHIVTGVVKLLGDLPLAAHLVLNEQETAKTEYLVDEWTPNGPRGSWEDARSFIPWLRDYVQEGAATDMLDALPPHLLPPQVRALLAAWAESDARDARRAKRSRYGLAGGRVRQPRANQKSPKAAG